MKCGEYDSPTLLQSLRNRPYGSTLAEEASASSDSGWSDTSSQNSDNSDETSTSTTSSSSDLCDSHCTSQQSISRLHQQQCQAEVPPELRQNPRRSCHGISSRTGHPPSLVRQADRKVSFVDNLVDSSTQIVEAIWPTSSVACRNESGNGGVLPLRTFIQETLRRSRTSYSTLQVALYYLILIKPHVPDHDFTMEQPDDCHASRALQCGRRMFLAALILASKYLQDRNYSARAWSKISGLNTQEINQNEMAFLLAVNWKLHISDEVYNRWTECVMKHTPSQPPSPGSQSQRHFERQCEDFKSFVLKLTPELDNLEDSPSWIPAKARAREFRVPSPRSLLESTPTPPPFGGYDIDVTPTAKNFGTPIVMEPSPAATYTPGRLAPALGLLPTPRLTPQPSGFNTPAVSATSYTLGKGCSSMGFAMAQANCAYSMDRWPVSTTSSPQTYFSTRRSSLANPISTASSPESMISDTSRTSRSSSISSASSLVSAPSVKLDVQARFRYAMQCSERYSLRTVIATVPEDYEENSLTSSPDSYTGPVGKDLCSLSLDTPMARKGNDEDDGNDSINSAARALQELHKYRHDANQSTPVVASRVGSKRSRSNSADNPLQDSVRDILGGHCQAGEKVWSNSFVRARNVEVVPSDETRDSRKRVCCAAEASEPFVFSSLHPAVGGRGAPGMWTGILN